MMVWGVNLSAVKGLTESLDLMLVASVRMVLATVVLAMMAAFFGGGIRQPWTWEKWLLLLAAAFFLVCSQQIAFAEGLFRTSATNAALVMALGPTVSLSLEALFFKRAVTRQQISGIVLALVGVSVVILNRPQASLTAAAWGGFVDFCLCAGICIGRTVHSATDAKQLPVDGELGGSCARGIDALCAHRGFDSSAIVCSCRHDSMAMVAGRFFRRIRYRDGVLGLVQRHCCYWCRAYCQLHILGTSVRRLLWGHIFFRKVDRVAWFGTCCGDCRNNLDRPTAHCPRRMIGACVFLPAPSVRRRPWSRC